jgi:hypothetical protein
MSETHSTFENARRDAERIGPVGSAAWLYSWTQLKDEILSRLRLQTDADIDPCELADWQEELSLIWWNREIDQALCGNRLSHTSENLAYAPPTADATERNAAMLKAVGDALGKNEGNKD